MPNQKTQAMHRVEKRERGKWVSVATTKKNIVETTLHMNYVGYYLSETKTSKRISLRLIECICAPRAHIRTRQNRFQIGKKCFRWGKVLRAIKKVFAEATEERAAKRKEICVRLGKVVLEGDAIEPYRDEWTLIYAQIDPNETNDVTKNRRRRLKPNAKLFSARDDFDGCDVKCATVSMTSTNATTSWLCRNTWKWIFRFGWFSCCLCLCGNGKAMKPKRKYRTQDTQSFKQFIW